MIVRITQLDGKLPNLALMRLGAWHRGRGDDVHYYRGASGLTLQLGEPAYDRVYGGAIFEFTAPLVERFRRQFSGAIVGGTWNKGDRITVEQIVGRRWEEPDYAIDPHFTASLGFTQRGCRFNCDFCDVPAKEGKPRASGTIPQIWRGEPWPRNIHLLDNDFFGVSKPEWKARLAEIRDGGFRVAFNQGINVRVITDEIAADLATIEYRDDQFKRRRLYTAWDAIGDGEMFFKGVARLDRAGIPPSHLLVFMLVGHAENETWTDVFYRFNRMVELGIRPYPMPYQGGKDRRLARGGINQRIEHKTLGDFQRWVTTGLYRDPSIPFEAYNSGATPRAKGQPDLFDGGANA
jgi:hypothetical protein